MPKFPTGVINAAAGWPGVVHALSVALIFFLALNSGPRAGDEGAVDGELSFRRGDVNFDGSVDISDAIRTFDFLFLGGESVACPDAADTNDDGIIDISDGIFVLGYLFRGQDVPPPPGPVECGVDPTADDLDACLAPGGGIASCPPGGVGVEPERAYKRVIYWGQNAYGGRDPERDNWEPSLGETCESGDYDIVLIGFLHIYFDSRNPGRLPGLNLSYHCGTLFRDYVSLLNCSRLAPQIASCQERGVQVLISLGGGVGVYRFDDDAQARGFADTIWNMFLGGRSDDVPRPFGDAVLDGADLNIEAGGFNHHAAFAGALRARMDSDESCPYLLTAAPQCPFPDAHLGPGPGSVFGEHGADIDLISIQFYNNFCRYSPGRRDLFIDSYRQWSSWSQEVGGPQICIGLPALPRAAPAGGYVPRDELAGLFSAIVDDEKLGGFMLWDASYDYNSVEDGMKYSEFIDGLLNNP